MQEAKNITTNKNTEIHVSGGKIYETRESLCELEDKLGDGFIRVHCGCILFDISEIKFTKNSGDAE